ncbi:MAG: hypothetical protein ACI4EA_04575 [Candidatus Ornithomonoglobus sp.]
MVIVMFNEELISFQLMLKAGYKNRSGKPGTSEEQKEKFAGFIDKIDRTIAVLKAAIYSPQAVREAAAREDPDDINTPLGHLDRYLFKVCRVTNPNKYRDHINEDTDYICIGNSCTCTETGVVDYLQLTDKWLSNWSFMAQLEDLEIKGDYKFD